MRHGRQVVEFVVSTTEPDGTVVVMTDGGLADVSGAWTVTVDELVGDGVRLAGPWILQFSAP